MNERRAIAALMVGLALMLAASSLPTLGPALARSGLAQALIRAGLRQTDEALRQPFLCLRPPLTSASERALAADILARLPAAANSPAQARLQLAAACLLGENPSSDGVLPPFHEQDAYLLVQRSMAEAGSKPEELAQNLMGAGLGQRELMGVVQTISSSAPEVDLRPTLRALAQAMPDYADVWRLWLQVGYNLQRLPDWQAMAGWLEEGESRQAQAGVRFYLSSYDLNIGRYYQYYSQPNDPQTALAYYDRALNLGQYLSLGEPVTAHLYRGEIYRALKDSHTPAEALSEFELALALDPQSYWAELSIGNVYLYDLRQPAQAQVYYRQAIAKRPELPYTYYYLGELYRLEGDPAQAEAYYRQALERQADYQPALNGLKGLEARP